VARAASAAGVGTFVLISTDKAVDPVNVLGATKRLAEMACQALASQSSTNFVTVRFGNVLDSAGSVVPLFREQIRTGGPVTVTDPHVTRYFMTIPEACQLIMQSVAIGAGQAVYTLDMGEPVSIRLLAEQMIRLAGKHPERDVAIVYTGLRPGEKLHETLFHADESYRPTIHPKILQAEARDVPVERVNKAVIAMREAVANYDLDVLATLLRDSLPEFRPLTRLPTAESGTVVSFPARQARRT
jgi:FlaA1/EpsC-like NDP-sugar epimerase